MVTDHKQLVNLKNITDPGSRLVHWQEHLEGLEFEVIYKKGILNGNADGLSRMFLTKVVTDDEKLVFTTELQRKNDYGNIKFKAKIFNH